MNRFNHLISWITAFAVFLAFEEIIQYPSAIWFLAPIAVIGVVLMIWQLTGREVKIEKFWRYIITPSLFLAGSLLFLSFLEGRLTRQFSLIGFCVLLWAYLQIIYLRFHSRPQYEPYSLENMTSHLNLLTVYLVAAGFYSLILFFDVNFWLLFCLFFLASALMAYQVVWASSTTARVGWPYIAGITLVTAEVYLAASYLPTSIYVNGLLAALSYYLAAGLSRNWLLEIKSKGVLLRYLAISLLVVLIILLTAKWF